MNDNDELEAELISIDDELETIEQQLADILERQTSLNERARQIREMLAKDDAKRASTAHGDDTSDVAVKSVAHDAAQFENTSYPWSERLIAKRNAVFHIDHFRPLQLATMNATLSGQDCLLIMPTGGGKSLCYQLPALVSDGITLVISPLVSLMEDQLMALHDLAVDAVLLNAASTKEEVNRVQAAMIDQNAPLKLVYVTPEKIAKSKRFMARVEKTYAMGRLARIAIDEVHCCSQWGHDFRPDYKILGILKRQFPKCPILGLTATATQRVLDDVKKILNLPNCPIFRASFNRANLYYEVYSKPSSQKEMIDEIQKIIEKRFKDQSGIIYCFSRNDTESVARDLQSRGVRAACYHAYLEPHERKQVHRKWVTNRVQVIVATVAFGMGIDKANVRFVIHHSLSKSMENYYQESGRAGRDDQPAACILYFRLADLFRQSTMVFTEQTGLENLYKMADYCLDVTICRRDLIARHFGERWDASHCRHQCDHCTHRQRMTVEERDVVGAYREVARVLRAKATKEKRLTGLKLAELCQAEKALMRQMGASDAERVLGRMLLDGYLREDFHFTPYNTISYVVPGPRIGVVEKSGTQRPIFMKFSSPNYKTVSASVAKAADVESTRKQQDAKRKATPEVAETRQVSALNGKATRSIDTISKVGKVEKIVIDLDDFEFDDDALAPSSGVLDNRTRSKRKEQKATLASEAKKIRLIDAQDTVDGKKRSDERKTVSLGVVHDLGSSSSSECDVKESRRVRRRQRNLQHEKKLLPRLVQMDVATNGGDDVVVSTSPNNVAVVCADTTFGTGSSLGDCSTIVRGVFKRLRRERETLSASLETENSMKERAMESLQAAILAASAGPGPRSTKSEPSTSRLDSLPLFRLSKSAELEQREPVDSDKEDENSASLSDDTDSSLSDEILSKSTTDLELENLDENSNEISKSEDDRPVRKLCWQETKCKKVKVDKSGSDPDPMEIAEKSVEDSRRSDLSDSFEKLEKSDELSHLYQIYTDQLSTLAVRDDSSDEAEVSDRARAPSTLAPIAERPESELILVQRPSRRRSRTISAGSAGSVDQSMTNLEQMRSSTIATSSSLDDDDDDDVGSGSEAEMTQLHDVYVNQLISMPKV